jgi:hypothetical protein
MSSVLATTDTKVRWYAIHIEKTEDIANLKAGDYELLEELNLALVPGFGSKDTAKRVAMAVGLKTWRYVKIDTPNQIYTISR